MARLILTMLLVGLHVCTCVVVDFKTAGGVPGETSDHSTIKANTALLERTVNSFKSGDTLIISNETFVVTGNIILENLTDVTIQIDGTLSFSDDIKHWPKESDGETYATALTINNTTNLLITSTGKGTLDGNGATWWGIPYVGYLERGKNRPPLLNVNYATGFIMEHILLLNSPRFHFTSSYLRQATIRHVNAGPRRETT